ncbi:Surfactin synthase thioesterase subunit [Micromonospora pallida]|uniref:Surfactin synthase thioesterase subunit n=1 Tax=Micromonospora pallida TaxID=145854 RepID=A0A1C6SDN1_9ACTN|nr:alpha/beta fold hydrolase [Micromonospora pallida]SCL27417.1 Surfactin synthase thioesterase subunit [Micromonospora pallida]
MPRRSRWLAQEPRAESTARVFCLPFAGTGAGLLRQWPHRIGPVEVCRVQLPGRENRIREEAFADFDTFAETTAEALAPYLDRPYALFGHCMGALLAHRLAVALEARPVRPPARLVVSSSLPPHFPPETRYRPPGTAAEGIYHPSMTDAELTGEIRRVARAQGQPEILAELLPLAVRTLRRDLDMCYRYAPAEPTPVRCPITTVGWSRDPDVAPYEMTVWERYGRVDHHTLDGDKLTFIRAPQPLMDVLAEELLANATDSGERR